MPKDVPSNDSGKASCRTAAAASGATGAAPGRMACRTMAFSCRCNKNVTQNAKMQNECKHAMMIPRTFQHDDTEIIPTTTVINETCYKDKDGKDVFCRLTFV